MTIWEVYEFPDDGGATFEGVIEGLPERIFREMTEQPGAGWLLSVQPRDSAAMLLVVSDRGITPQEDDSLYVPEKARGDCVAAMSQMSITDVEWRRLYAIEFRSKAAQAAFERYSKTPSADWRTSS